MKREQSGFSYEDIIHLQRPVSNARRRMPVSDRAAQFQPFSALTGYDAAVKETERLTEEEMDLDENYKDLMNCKLQRLVEIQQQHPLIAITYFLPDEKKTGGCYRSIKERIKKVDGYDRCLYMENGSRIPIEHITDIRMVDETIEECREE